MNLENFLTEESHLPEFLLNDYETSYMDIYTESTFKDTILNMDLTVNVSRATRKLIISKYITQKKIMELSLKDKKENKNEIKDLTVELANINQALDVTKDTSDKALKKDIQKLELEAKRMYKEMIKEMKAEIEEDERIEECVSVTDIERYIITESAGAQISDAINTLKINTLGKLKDKGVQANIVYTDCPEAKEKVKELKKEMNNITSLSNTIYSHYANQTIFEEDKLSDYILNPPSKEDVGEFYKFNNKFIYVSSVVLLETKSLDEDKSKIGKFTSILHIMRRITKEIQKKGISKNVVIKCIPYHVSKKEKLKGIVILATIKTKVGKANKNSPLPESNDNDNVTEESTLTHTLKNNKDNKIKIPPELKRLDFKRGLLAELIERRKEAKHKYVKTGESKYEKSIKGLDYKIEKLEKEIEEGGEELKTINEINASVTKESVYFMEARNMEPEIKPIVDTLNKKGYIVKYASPGHNNLRKKEDAEPDGTYYGKLYSDARIMFDAKYTFPVDTPKYWHWREVDGCSYLDITPLKYDKDSGDTPNKAFEKWKNNYMYSLKKFVNELPENNTSSSDITEKTNDFFITFMDELFTESLLDTIGSTDTDSSDESLNNFDENNYSNMLIKELNSLLS